MHVERVVLGGGLTGLSAGDHLQAAGSPDFVILEPKRRGWRSGPDADLQGPLARPMDRSLLSGNAAADVGPLAAR
jgi:glycine/D-amino acid oxidase-like deaminating enzyme